MGRLVPETDDFGNEQSSAASGSNPRYVRRVLSDVCGFAPDDLKSFFHSLFLRMNAISKEAMMDMMWESLTLREQRLFDLPYYGQNSSDTETLSAFRSPWVRPNSESGTFEMPTRPDRAATARIRRVPPSDSSATTRAAHVSHSGSNTTATNTSEELALIRRPSDTFQEMARRARPPSRTYMRDFEDRILNMLMDSLLRDRPGGIRAAANPPRETVVPLTVRNPESPTTNSTDEEAPLIPLTDAVVPDIGMATQTDEMNLDPDADGSSNARPNPSLF